MMEMEALFFFVMVTSDVQSKLYPNTIYRYIHAKSTLIRYKFVRGNSTIYN